MKNLRNLIACLFLTSLFAIPNVSAESKPSFNNVAICRIQLKVKTNTIKNADTDSPIWIQLNSKDAPYYLNNSGNDREKNRTDTYDILSSNINKIGDIKMINLGNSGPDGWNFTSIELIVNNKSLFKKKFSKSGQWIDGKSKKHPKTYKVNTQTLRKSPNWKYNGYTNFIYMAPNTVSLEMIKSFVESTVGNTLQEVKEITWGKKYGKEYVTAKRINANTLRFDLDLTYEIDYMPNPSVDVDFDLVFTCQNGVIRTTIKNYKSKVSGASKYFAKGLKKFKGAILEGCGKIPVPGSTYACEYGLNKIDKWLDFNFDYDGPGNLGISKSCSGTMFLDMEGNLFLSRKKGGTIERKIAKRGRKTNQANKTTGRFKIRKK
jgi:hypothetical protein